MPRIYDHRFSPAAAVEPELQSHRALALVAAAGLFAPASTVWIGSVHSAAVAIAGAALTGAALLLICVIATARTSAHLERLDRWLLGTGIVALIALACAQAAQQPYHSTGAAALIQGGAVALSRGHDPYGTNLGWSLVAYAGQAPAHLLSGWLMDTLSTPSLPVLLTLPLVALGVHGAVVTVLATACLCVAAAVMFVLLPRPLRPLAVIVCIDVAVLPVLASAGASVVMMLAALSVCALRWRIVGEAGGRLGRGGLVRAVCLGLAVSADQIAWFVVPFLLVGTYLAARERFGGPPARQVVGRYALVAGAVFLALNAPFAVWGPHAWLTDVTAPLARELIPSGRGLVGLATLAQLGGGALDFYGYGTLLLYVALLAVFVLRFDRLARCLFLFPLAALYTSDRPLSSDWLAMIGVVVVSALCSGGPPDGLTDRGEADAVSRAAGSRSGQPGRGLWKGALFLPALVCFFIALTTPGPLTLELVASHHRRGERSPTRLAVMVSNDSSRSLAPRFAIDSTGPASRFWRLVSGPTQLRPRTTARYVIAAPNQKSEPSPGATYIVQAVTSTPRTISSSAAIVFPKAPRTGL